MPARSAAGDENIGDAEEELFAQISIRFGLPRQTVRTALEAAGRLIPEELAVVEELLRSGTDDADASLRERRQAIAEGLREAIEQLRARPTSDPLADVDEPLTTRTTAEVELWASLESQLNRSQLLRDCVSASRAGEITGRSRQAIERLRRQGRALALRLGRRWRYPAWQFDVDGPGGLLPGLPDVLERLRLSPAGAAHWLTQPRPELDDKLPIRLLRDRQVDRVVRLAEAQGHLP